MTRPSSTNLHRKPKPPRSSVHPAPLQNIDPEAGFAAVVQATRGNAARLPPYLRCLLEGSGASLADLQPYPFPRPDWLDEEKLRRGRRFAGDHLMNVMYATLVTIAFSFVSRDTLKPLIFTGNSNTPYKAFNRYASTVSRVTSWYFGDMWQEGDAAHKNMKSVRAMHQRIKRTLTNASPAELAKRETNEGKPMWTDLHQELLNDFLACPALETPIVGASVVPINQTDMAVTQFGFIGLFLLHPKMFGVHNASREDLDAYVHLWRAIGYLLGIEDRYNLCAGTLEETQQRCRDLLDFWLRPLLRYISRDWMHMARCMYEGFSYYSPGTSFEGSMMYLCKILDVPTPRLANALTFRQKCAFKFQVFMMKYLIRMPGVLKVYNYLFRMSLERSLKGLPEKKDTVYPYETQGVCPMKL